MPRSVSAWILACLGVWQLTRKRSSDRLTLAVAGWVAAFLVFAGLAGLSPVEMRYHLATTPALVLLAALGVSTWWRASGWRRIAVGAMCALIAVTGFFGWLEGVM